MKTRKYIKNNQRGHIKILLTILIILIIILSILLVLKIWKEKEDLKNVENVVIGTDINMKLEEKRPKTLAGNERPIAVMIDNNIKANPQAGLEQAELIYEMIVEGGETRLMLVMKNTQLDRIGPMRSARHYFLDYALENDAIYVHYGQSPQAESDIGLLNISDINGMYESLSLFWRDPSRYSPHNAVTSTENINKIIERKKIRTTSTQKNVLNYVIDEIELDKIEKLEEGEVSKIKQANIVNIPYSPYNNVRYEYDSETKNYIRYSKNKKQIDWNTKNAITVKNIIITKCSNVTLNDGSREGRQTLYNIKTLDGYYITNGQAIPIKCEKTSRKSKTVYKTLDGDEIKVNDGKTFIQICPINSKITFK